MRPGPIFSISDVENNLLLDMHQHLDFPVHDAKFTCDRHLIGIGIKQSWAFVHLRFCRVSLRKLHNQYGSLQIQKEVVGWVIGSISWVDHCISLGNAGKLIGGVELVGGDPGGQPTESSPQRQQD